MTQQQQAALDFALGKLTPPTDYQLQSCRPVIQDEVEAFVFRYERADGSNNGLGGEHYSFTVSAAPHKILGLMWANPQFADGQPLPDDERTAPLARSLVEHIEPGLLDKAEYRWTRPESFTMHADGQAISITGMRYKLYLPETGKWAWVIVAPTGQIMTFEQDMIWRGGRISEMWLHDEWLLRDAQNHRVKNFVKSMLRRV